MFAKFAAPTVANGKVYLATFSKQLVVYGLLAPTLTTTLSSTAPDPTNRAIAVTATFSQPVADFTAADVTVTNATVANFGGSGTSYHFDLNPDAPGAVTASIAAGAAHDSQGTPNLASAVLSRVFDDIPVQVTLASSAPNPTIGATIAVTATFDKPVADFVAADIATTNATVANFSGSGSVYHFDLTAQSPGIMSATVPAGVAHDAAGNANSASAPLSRQFGALQQRVLLALVAR